MGNPYQRKQIIEPKIKRIGFPLQNV